MNDSPPSPVVDTISGFTAERIAAEAELTRCSVPQPVSQQAECQRAHGAVDTMLVVARTPSGDVLRSAGVAVGSSRALPGHRVFRVERYGGSSSISADDATLAALAELARRDARCLRLVVEIFERDPGVRARLATTLDRLGFTRATKPRMYTHTVGVEIGKPTSEVLSTLHKTARRNIRSPSRCGFEVRPITEVQLAPRLGELARQTFRRTATLISSKRPWAEIVEFSAASPQRSRVAGLFDPNAIGPERLIAFAWGCAHGGYASYEEGASVRRPDSSSISLGYAPLWDLIVWANEQTPATWFDLGGITAGGDGDAQRGITEFKRYFSRDVVDVGEEWIIEPNKVRGAIARGVSAAINWIERLSRNAGDRQETASAPTQESANSVDRNSSPDSALTRSDVA